jgi:D-alanyl-D-alanine dipeptidase
MRFDKTKGRPEPVLALDKMPELENGDPLVDLRVVAPHIKVVRPQTIPWCRKRVAEMASEAALKLPKGYQLGVTEGWRPIDRQWRIYEFMWKSAEEAFPDRSFSSLRRTVNRWVAPPNRKAPPGHCTGAALDVNLLDESGEVVDVSAPYERFQAAPTYALGINSDALEKRMMLVETMLSVGFSNCRDEWWHYSYGDAGWAVRMAQPICFYGLIHLEMEHYEEQEELAEEAMKERTNPFLG